MSAQRFTKRQLQRLSGDPEILEAIDTLQAWGIVTGSTFDRLVKAAETAVLTCKHCGLAIVKQPSKSKDWLHAEGSQRGMNTCAISPYGFHAEPEGVSCRRSSANPCNGASGIQGCGTSADPKR